MESDSPSMAATSLTWPLASPAEYIDRFRAGSDNIVLCLSLVKVVPVIVGE